jgi:lipopolysaccharide export system protein LptA
MKKLFVFSLAFFFGAAFSGALEAQPAKPSAKPSSAAKDNCEINATSDKFIADLNGKTGQFVGNVVVTQCDTRLRADTVRITTVNNQADKVNASGNVVVDSPKSGTATGQTGVYDVPRRMVTMSGNVVLKKGKDVARGQQLTVNLTTGEASLSGGVKSRTAPGGRVQAVFHPNTSPSQ